MLYEVITQVSDLSNVVSLQIKERQIQISSSIEIATEILNSIGHMQISKTNQIFVQAINQATHEVKNIELPALSINKKPVYSFV